MTINPAPVAPTSGGDITECQAPTIQTLTAIATVNSGETVSWYEAATGGTSVSPTLSSVGTKTYYAETSNGTCSSLTRTPVMLTIKPTPAAPVLSATTITNPCPVTTANLLTAHTETTPANASLVWYTMATPMSTDSPYATPATAATGATYYAFYKGTNGCLSQASEPLAVTTSVCCPAGYDAPIIH